MDWENRVQALIVAKSADRLSTALRERAPGVEVIAWQPDGSLRRDGQPVAYEDVAPQVGWIGNDVFAGKHMKAYGEALLRFESMAWVQSANAGLDFAIYPKLDAAGVRITKSGAQSIAIAEYVVAYALETFQKTGERRAAQAEGRWHAHRFRELWHARWLLIGYGHIGRNVAKRARAFDSHVTAIRASGQPDEYADVVATPDAIDRHLPQADIVVLACPATERTRGMVGEAFLGQMKDSSLLINVARGSLVDEAALVAALDAGRPAHAVLDVFETEPLPPASPLWSHPAVTVTAHTSNAGSGTRERGDELFLSNLERFVAGKPLYDEARP